MTRPLHTVRTTRRPDRVIEVDDATLLDLTRRGQLLPVEPEAEKVDEVSEPEPRPVPDATPEAFGVRRRRAAGARPPTTPPALG